MSSLYIYIGDAQAGDIHYTKTLEESRTNVIIADYDIGGKLVGIELQGPLRITKDGVDNITQEGGEAEAIPKNRGLERGAKNRRANGGLHRLKAR